MQAIAAGVSTVITAAIIEIAKDKRRIKKITNNIVFILISFLNK
jgi:hypothetical protein